MSAAVVSSRSFVPRGSLLIVQVALSLVLLSSAGLLATSLGNLEQQPLGFTPSQSPRDLHRAARHARRRRAAADAICMRGSTSRLRQVPGVERVAFSMYSPMEGNNWSSGISIGGRTPDPDTPTFVVVESCDAGLLRDRRHARGPRARDRRARHAGGKRVAVVNEALVRRYFENEDPIGRTLGIGDVQRTRTTSRSSASSRT